MACQGSNVGPGVLSATEGAILVFSANLPLLRPLLRQIPVAIRFSNAHDDKYSKLSGPLVMKPSPSRGRFLHSVPKTYIHTDLSK